MGKKTRKTRWRTLTIADEQSDSDDASHTSSSGGVKSYNNHHHNHQSTKSFYNNFTYSSQSTPRRRYHHHNHQSNDLGSSTKSTRSSSTASETKITFNEDEYTRITTPRQDVLFKKGYLSKPKNYQTQTSTGTSTTSTGNSTGNGTPDHQSTDLEYESQFVFPNGFVDQNGIYYVNSYESYPLVLYNPPTYYPEFSNVKSKRYSTGSLTESMSPNNEEATSQDLSQSGGEQHPSNNVPDFNGPVFNMVYPGYYINNGVCPPQEILNGDQNHHHQTETESRRIKKRRRRKTSKSASSTTSEDTEDDVFNAQSELKPDAEEFVPRNYQEAVPVQFFKIPPNFVPVPIVNGPAAFIPPPPLPAPVTLPPSVVVKDESNRVDIAKIVSKLEEAAKEQAKEEPKKNRFRNSFKKSGGDNQRRKQGNYSDVVKKAASPMKQRRVVEEKPREVLKPNQWISVSNRKNKRKNRKEVEVEVEEEEVVGEPSDLFESYDVSLLEDVVVVPETQPVVMIEVKEEEEIVVKDKKKKPAKKPIKRVIITDVDLSSKVEEEVKNIQVKKPVVVAAPPVKEPAKIKVKKSKKKKDKKIEVVEKVDEQASYEFLDQAGAVEKTNLEISAELDKIIQKGMYSNLEEKIRNLDISDKDGFFETLKTIESATTTPPTTTTTPTTLSKLLNPSQIFKTNPVSVLEELPCSTKLVDVSKIQLPDLEPTVVLADGRSSGVFLVEASPPPPPPPPSSSSPLPDQNLYPITQAVKEWMSKTREATPEVELLKSPSAIYREFYDEEDEQEVTLFERGRDTVEEPLEVYESTFGQNRDFLQLQAEVAHNRETGELPHPNRAICCTVA